MSSTDSDRKCYLGIDVGTGSARAALFDARGTMLGMGTSPIEMFRPAEDFVEQSSEDIWRACGEAVRKALAEGKIAPSQVRGIGFDATCSMAVLGENDEPVSVSPTGRDAQNVIVWMDHRAVEQAGRINAQGHEVLRYVGGVISPEMQTPKLLWLAEHAPQTWKRAARFLDLPDYLTYRATGNDTRSLCTTTCKWTYVARNGGWDAEYFRSIGLGALVDEGYARIGTRVRPMGEFVGVLTEGAANDLGLLPGTPVGVGIIDAHAGGLGTLGMAIDGAVPDEAELQTRLALIGGTSSCHMAVSREARFVQGVWGPYESAMVPGLWLSEGGQSATGALIDFTIGSHARAAELREEGNRRGVRIETLLGERLASLADAHKLEFTGELVRDLHVLPDHHGNRSPRADPTARGMVSGLKLDDGADSLARLYLATIQGIAYGTRHIIDAMSQSGYAIRTLVACGGGTKNPIFLREHADATQCNVVLPKEPEAVLLGAAILGAVSSGDHRSIVSAMGAMSGAGTVITPSKKGGVRDFHDRKYQVFLAMYKHQMHYRSLMSGAPA
ncbi:FGGY-family carbohydrate kinase [Pendulispora albinea]|uniref:FGGY-family carbohydrate kinase n=1 Tax=Pendulispora albinea TaxID=2741071 RepID=A0ABZ2LN79_9BACT